MSRGPAERVPCQGQGSNFEDVKQYIVSLYSDLHILQPRHVIFASFRIFQLYCDFLGASANESAALLGLIEN